MNSDLRQTWATPSLLFSHLQDEFEFDLDVAASKRNAKCSRFFTEADSALDQIWGPRASAWCNPPFKTIEPWAKRAVLAAMEWESQTVLLVPASVDTAWFHDQVVPHSQFWFFRGRINFRPPGKEIKADSGPAFGCLLAHFAPGISPGFMGGRCPRTGQAL